MQLPALCYFKYASQKLYKWDSVNTRITKFVTNINSFLNTGIRTRLQDSTNYFSTTTKALTLSVKQLWWDEACSVYQLVKIKCMSIFSETVSYHQLLRTVRVTVPKTLQINCKTLLPLLAINTSYLMAAFSHQDCLTDHWHTCSKIPSRDQWSSFHYRI